MKQFNDNDNDNFLIINDVYKDYPGLSGALKGVSFRQTKGETVVIVGPSGSGKSTLLRCISGLETVERGSISLNGAELTRDPQVRDVMRKEIGMVFQSYNLFPHLTVIENITLAPIKVNKKAKGEAGEKALELLHMVGLSDKAKMYPRQLSGGQRQRVAIARTLAMDPMLLLFDEVTSALDPEMIGEVLAVMNRLAADGATMLVVTHEMAFAREAGDNIIFMEDGVIVEKSPTAVFFSGQASERTRTFLGALGAVSQ